MSWKVANLCDERKFGSPVRKQIIMFLADKASDDGSGIWCSKGTVHRHTELGESTVKRTIGNFLDEGLLVETGRRPCKNGFTVIYCINLRVVADLEKISEPDDDPNPEAGPTGDGELGGPGTGSALGGVRGPERTPNHPKTIHKPPTRTSVAAEEIENSKAEKILEAYPKDRIRDRPTCLALILALMEVEVSPDDLLQSIKAYAVETEGYTRGKVCFSDNWFKDRRWEKRLEKVLADREASLLAEAKGRASLAAWIHECHPLCRHITPRQLDGLLEGGLVTASQVKAAGLSL